MRRLSWSPNGLPLRMQPVVISPGTQGPPSGTSQMGEPPWKGLILEEGRMDSVGKDAGVGGRGGVLPGQAVTPLTSDSAIRVDLGSRRGLRQKGVEGSWKDGTRW